MLGWSSKTEDREMDMFARASMAGLFLKTLYYIIKICIINVCIWANYEKNHSFVDCCITLYLLYSN